MSLPSVCERPDVNTTRCCLFGLVSVLLLAACATGAPERLSQWEEKRSIPTQAGVKEYVGAPNGGVHFPTTWVSPGTDMPLTFESAWWLALQNDPNYRAAISGRAAQQTEARQGRAALLPQVSLGYSRSKVAGFSRQHGGGATLKNDLDYDSSSAYLQLHQPVFNLERYAEFQGGLARAQLGEAEFVVQEHGVAMRLALAYLEAVEAQGAVELARALVESLDEQAAMQAALFTFNESALADVQETRARLALARADKIGAEDRHYVARRRLGTLIGHESLQQLSIKALDGARAHLQEPLLHWLDRARAYGAVVRAAQAKIKVADTEVSRTAGRRYPSVALVLSLAHANSENLDALSQRSNTFTAGLQLLIPIYTGGYNTADHARSRHERTRAEHELTQTREQAVAETVRRYTAVQGGGQRITALMSAVLSGEESLKAARYGYEYGVNSNLDILRRQDSLFRVRHELLEARIDWLEARIALAAATGGPMSAVFMELDRTLMTGRQSSDDFRSPRDERQSDMTAVITALRD